MYDPLPSQKTFHASEARFKGFSGPIGCGKSQALCQEAIRLSYMNPGRLGLLGAPTYPMLRDATQATLFEILDHNEVPYDHNKAENSLLMKDTGSRILFRAVDEFERLRGNFLRHFTIPRSDVSTKRINSATSSESANVARISLRACFVFSFERSSSLYARVRARWRSSEKPLRCRPILLMPKQTVSRSVTTSENGGTSCVMTVEAPM